MDKFGCITSRQQTSWPKLMWLPIVLSRLREVMWMLIEWCCHRLMYRKCYKKTVLILLEMSVFLSVSEKGSTRIFPLRKVEHGRTRTMDGCGRCIFIRPEQNLWISFLKIFICRIVRNCISSILTERLYMDRLRLRVFLKTVFSWQTWYLEMTCQSYYMNREFVWDNRSWKSQGLFIPIVDFLIMGITNQVDLEN